ncbi:MAG: DNA polymerase III subunit beta [Desulfobacteraceae bacterium]|nr:DNA polymerase III subunit beta [Desulfobacteraceae bacterium]MBC2756651.1 DNA polymerase III subunit beta [Desulfobacteraceae bacterium]
MKFTIQKNEITDVLSRIQGIVGRKTSLAITENVLIKASGDEIILSATDLETGFEGSYTAVVEASGVVAVNASKFHDIVKMFPTDYINIEELDNRWIEISSENVEYHLVGMNPEDFPDIPKVEDVNFFTINSESFKKMIEKSIVISVAGDEKREHMIGVNLERLSEDKKQIIRMVSTDIKRLSMVDYLCENKSKFNKGDNIIVPKKGLAEVNKFLETEGDVDLGVKANHFIVKKDNETIIINLLEGEFPQYHDLLNIDDSFDVEFDRNLLLMMLKRMAIITSDEYRGVVFHLENNELMIRATNPNIGESKEKITISFKREMVEAAFNPKYFIEALNYIETEKVLLNIKDGESPCIVRGGKNAVYLNIIMPMKI